MAAAAEWLHSAPTPFLLWLHSRGMNGSWDAPREFRQRFVDAEDPEPPDFVVPPDRKLPVQADPDEVLGVTQAYAGQLLALDICLGMFLQAFADSPLSRSTLLVLASPRGYALGEHGFIGSCGDQLCGEVLQVPLLVRFPDGFAAGQRFQTLVQPADLYATLCEWFALDGVTADWSRSLIALAKDESAWRRECACSLRPGQRSIRTAAWFLRESEFAPPALYAKPDDRWEMNEVASRCGEVVESLQAAVEMFRKAAESRQLGELPALPPISVGLAD
jgi:arylsulfatase A-like enzyme